MGMHNGKSDDGPNGVFFGLTHTGGFQDLSAENRSVRVLRHDIAGLTIYANTGQANDRELWRDHSVYVLAYESEVGPHDELQQVILESDKSVAVFRMLDLINFHAERIQADIKVMLEASTVGQTQNGYRTFDAPIDLLRISGFSDDTIKQAIQQSLLRLSDKPIHESYEGFKNAVISKVDDWLMEHSLRADDLPDAHII